MIAPKVRKCPLSPFVTSNVVLSCLVRMADILARLVQKEDSLSALQLTGALFTINWGTLCQTHLPPPPIHPYPPASVFSPLYKETSTHLPPSCYASPELLNRDHRNEYGFDQQRLMVCIWCVRFERLKPPLRRRRLSVFNQGEPSERAQVCSRSAVSILIARAAKSKMAVDGENHRHKAGPLKQQNKSHKRGRHRSHREIEAQNKGNSILYNQQNHVAPLFL